MAKGKQTKKITHDTMMELVNANVIRQVSVHNDGKWWLLIELGNVERVLVAKRGHIRKFASLNSVETYLRSVGVQRFIVEMV